MPKYASVTEAHELQQHGHAYIDVRSTAEYAQGHPAGSVNVPLLEPDEGTGQMAPNPDFIRVIQASFPPDSKLLVGCMVGGRSMRAAQMLEAFGFADVTNVKGGFAGARDPLGGLVDAGWLEAGLPVSDGAADGQSYRDLLTKADADS